MTDTFKRISAVGFIVACLGLGSCSTLKTKSDKEPVELTPEQELTLSRQLLPKIQSSYPAVEDEVLQNYVSSIGASLVTKNGLESSPYQYSFTVVQSPTPNAFALPAGRVFITLALLDFIKSEDELVGIIAHEVAHIQLRHTSLRLNQELQNNSKDWFYPALGAGVGIAVSGALSQSSDLSHLAMLAGTGFSSGVLIQRIIYSENSQKNELEADALASKWVCETGYDTKAVGEFYHRIKELAKNASSEKSFNTHPSSEKRIRQLASLSSDCKRTRDAIGRKQFDEMKSHLRATGLLEHHP